ncbi:MAG: acyl-CoA dehydrogenase [Burkholderiaceae bacterium]|uniref:Acyl-CoA dehydrogenase n=1 Tax=Cupriavidus metallidurans TaxID=119219 RepID=A0A482IU59_9BURK|nr:MULTISPECIES: acyl-CoA dehydrogenase family protein [Cupriavidus]PCH55683.1 MAG: acyl-CoA dehydrogenase [Burkholderiaceae bacterium]EKZ97547.1 acyl-CoA dehydrogenase [Cupriavidus sp. HMR-1]KWR86351.1 acyl-CoA dehydrogenase [Cupriavidus sp. SHE]QBP12438.1 acyl-CoA dehydrogenase [Cupriavidus metallidurans]QWC92386.1 acyl-CoA dehydrogenase family protein [Cupriavidus metallidurans]
MDGLETFRQEAHAWLEANCPAEMRQPVRNEDDICWGGRKFRYQSDAQRLWLQRMAEKGWTVPEWPTQYGGGGLSPAQARVLRAEMARLNCRTPLQSFGISMLGPALLKYGTEAQKQEHLPKIARGEIRWCQGYSEPNAGSDLAALQTRAEERDGHFIVNGQKIWTSYADKADWIFCLVRTDFQAQKHTGISFLLFDMETPGVSTRPIVLISGKSPFCETFFDDVKVPCHQLVGEPNRGWEIAKYLLTHEREMISAIGSRGFREPMGRHAAKVIGVDAQRRLDDPMLRAQIAQFEIDEAAFAAAGERARDLAKQGEGMAAFSSVLKYYGAELNKRRYELLMSVGGTDALEWEGERSQDGALARGWLRTKANSIEGGTSEVQLNIVAKRLLGLPGA